MFQRACGFIVAAWLISGCASSPATYSTIVAPRPDVPQLAPVGPVVALAKAAAGPTSTPAGLSFDAFMVNAVTDFVVERAKQEVLGWVADEFGKVLCSRHDGAGYDVRTYFPST